MRDKELSKKLPCVLCKGNFVSEVNYLEEVRIIFQRYLLQQHSCPFVDNQKAMPYVGIYTGPFQVNSFNHNFVRKLLI